MKKIYLSLLLIASILISGCTPKTITKIQYIKEQPYDFQTVNLQGAYIDLSPEEQVCIPKLQELNTIYKETKQFYDNQIEDYKTLSKTIDK